VSGAEPRTPGDRLTWVGHATVRLEIDGTRLLTDPSLRRRMAHLRRGRRAPPGVTDGLDGVLISHAHLDHLDFGSLRAVRDGPRLVVPRGVGRLLRRRRGLSDVVEVEPGDEVRIGSLTVTATHAEHDGRRLTGTAGPALGYLVAGTARVYFAGDTGPFAGMADLAGDLDVALLPVWGWGPGIGPGHLDPRTAAQTLLLLRPRIAIPVHWGTYWPLWMLRPPAYASWPGPAFAREAARVAPDVEVRVLAPGETTTVGAAPARNRPAGLADRPGASQAFPSDPP
jgi:L-ascorbate metabolism protein UlaG (beta-lactamase superfamily)